jgi:hypothetical protein
MARFEHPEAEHLKLPPTRTVHRTVYLGNQCDA